MHNLIPTLVLTSTLALGTLCAAEPSPCADLLPRMATTMHALRAGAVPTPEQRQDWRQWNSSCTARTWQDQLELTLPGGPPAPMVRDTPIYVPPDAPVASARRDDSMLLLPRLYEGIRLAPLTTCRTTYASHKGRAGAYTTCNTVGGY